MPKKKNVVTNAMRMLNAAKIPYKTVEYEHEGDIEENFGMAISALTGIEPERSFKTLVIRGERKGIMVACIPVGAEVDLKKLARTAGDKRAEMIHVKELFALTGYIRGGVSPIGMKKKYPTYVDASARSFESIAVSGGICGVTLLISAAGLEKATDCMFADITMRGM